MSFDVQSRDCNAKLTVIVYVSKVVDLQPIYLMKGCGDRFIKLKSTE